MRASLRAILIGSCVLIASRAGATTVPYDAGSLIIPTSASFQDDCGAVSAYGLVYDLLRANPWLAANGYTAITVHYAYNPDKTSPNRCQPTNKSTPPSSTTDPSWNDGCDFQVTSATTTPVMLLDTTPSAAADSTITTIKTTGKAEVYPQYAAQTISTASGVTTVGYLGGPFIISKSDVTTFLALMRGTITAYDSSGKAIDFSPFRKNKGACTWGTTHYVYVHRAEVAFNGPAGKDFTSTPPRLALLAQDTGSKTGEIDDGILETYLQDAGLDFTGAGGCPTGGVNCGSHSTVGQIYDVFDIRDLANDLEANVDSTGAKVYGMVWMPHWESNAISGKTPNTTEQAALTNLATFLNSPGGMMAECASVATLEGSYASGKSESTSNCSSDRYYGCADRSGPTQYQTCVNDGTGACSTTTTPWGVNKDLSGSTDSSGRAAPFSSLRNCTDITLSAGAQCAYFAYPGDPLAQTADYVWNTAGYDPSGSQWYTGRGEVSDWMPNTARSSIYRPGVMPLISAVKSLTKSKLDSIADARTMVTSDIVTRSIKDNTSGKGNIAYIGGHDLTGTVSGTKLVLETLLQLGIDTTVPTGTTYELSRATPIDATIGTSTDPSIIQGTYEYVYPVPTRTTVSLAADVPSFTFPFYAGHLRVRSTSGIDTSASGFSSGTDIFSTPTVSYGGCARPYNLSCRNIFIDQPSTGTTTTNTDGTAITVAPTALEVSDTNADTIGALIVPGMAHAQFLTMTERLLAGIPSGSSYIAELGGVDRSAVAVVPPSDYESTTRPTMIYFGATDGMLHAVCGETTTAPQPTCTYGEELWAFMPSAELPFVKTNTTRIDGSPHVVEMFGSFPGCGTGLKCFRTVLTFQTGFGTVGTAGQTPAVYALDVTDPTTPTVLWKDQVPTPSSAGSLALGVGETLGAGIVLSNGVPIPMVYAETNNGGTGGAGVVVTGIRADTGAEQFSVGYVYPAPGANALRTGTGADLPVPATGVPGGAVTISKTDDGYITDVVFSDLYGDIWEVDPLTGASRTGTATPLSTPLFSFSTDYQPIGSPPAVYSNGSTLFAVVATGGYADPNDSTWGTPSHYWVASVRLSPTGAVTYPLNESSGGQNVYTFQTSGRAYAQPTISDGQLLVVTDSNDINQVNYGTTTSASGTLYASAIGPTGLGTASTVVLQTGGTSVASDANGVYESSGSGQQKANGITAPPNPPPVEYTMKRLLWLRTE